MNLSVTDNEEESSSSLGLILAIVVVLAVIIGVIVGLLIRRKKRKNRSLDLVNVKLDKSAEMKSNFNKNTHIVHQEMPDPEASGSKADD